MSSNKAMDMDVDLGLEIKKSRGEHRVRLLHKLSLGRKATEVIRNIYRAKVKDALSIRTAQH